MDSQFLQPLSSMDASKATRNTEQTSELKIEKPVISFDQYRELLRTNISDFSNSVSATVDFRGFVQGRTPGKSDQYFYCDVISTKGIGKDETQGGVSLITEANPGPDVSLSKMKSEKDVAAYSIGITVSGKLLKELGMFCLASNFYSLEKKQRFDLDPEEFRLAQQDSHIPISLNFDVKNDPLARDKVVLIHHLLIRYVKERRPLDQIKDFAFKAADLLLKMNPNEVREKARLIQS